MEGIVLSPLALAVVPIVAGLLQVIKRTQIASMAKEWMPLLSLAAGVGISFAAGIANPVVTGIMIGLTASGGYDVLKGIKK